MAFLRIKAVKGNKYGYLVENRQTKKGPRQRVKRYLGKAVELKAQREVDFFEYFKVDDSKDYFKKNKKEILLDLVRLELIKHGFKEKGVLLSNQKVSFDEKSLKLLKGKKEVLLVINEGLLGSFTLQRILKFKKSGDFQKDANQLAKYFVEGGINVSQEVFIGFYKKD